MYFNLFSKTAKQGGGGGQGRGASQQRGKKRPVKKDVLQIINPRPSAPLSKQISDLQTFGGQYVARTTLNTIKIQDQLMRNMLQRLRHVIEQQTEYMLRIRHPDTVDMTEDRYWDVHFFYTIHIPQTIPRRITQKAQQLRKHYRVIANQPMSEDINWQMQEQGILCPCVSITSGQDGQMLSVNLPPTPMVDIPFFRTLVRNSTSAPYVFHLPRPTDNSPTNLLRHVSKEITRMKDRCHDYALELLTSLSDRISDNKTLMLIIQDMLKKTR